MVILYRNTKGEIWDLKKDEISKRLYKVAKFDARPRIILRHHQAAKTAGELKELFKINFDELVDQLNLGLMNFNVLIEQVDFKITQLAGRAANTLSGGEMQRLAMAILHTQSPRIALLDEPENHLDPGIMFHLLQILTEYFSNNNRSCVMVLHDPSVAVRLCSHLLLLFGDGRYIKGGAMEIATTENLSQLYAHKMLATPIDDGLLFYPE